jgi:hypothetical protein
MTDRTNTLRIPVRTTVLDECRLPEFQKLDLNFDELCQQRARSLLDHARATDRKLVICYSGGIDSTLILVSLFKIATDSELRQSVIVLLSDQSIGENPKFYRQYISKKCVMDSSYKLDHYLGNDSYVVVNGEGGDQLFGSAVSHDVVNSFGIDFLFSQPTPERIAQTMALKIPDETVQEKLISAFNRVMLKCPFNIETIYHYYWWINFTLKWQSVYVRTMAYTATAYQKTLKPQDNYFSFFTTDQMQLWTMNNPHMLIKDQWRTYKFHCKDIIYDFNGDAEYRDYKMKMGSLASIINTRPIAHAIDRELNFYFDDYPQDMWDMNNDFI